MLVRSLDLKQFQLSEGISIQSSACRGKEHFFKCGTSAGTPIQTLVWQWKNANQVEGPHASR
eukprot:2183698-Karenia_brevis.AAC.1